MRIKELGFFFVFFLANCTAAWQSPEPPKQQLPGGCLAWALDNQREGFCIAAGGPPKRGFWPKSCWFLSRTKHLYFVTGAARILPSPLTAGSLQKSFNTWRCFPNTGHRIRKNLKSRLLGGRNHNVHQDVNVSIYCFIGNSQHTWTFTQSVGDLLFSPLFCSSYAKRKRKKRPSYLS